MQKDQMYSANVILYIVSMTFAFTTRYGDLLLGKNLQFAIGLFWIMFALMQLYINRNNTGKEKREIKNFLKIYMFPHIVLHAYTICLMILGIVSWSYLTSNISVYIPTALAVLAVYLFREKTVKYTIISLVASWVLSVSVSTVLKGPMIFPHAIVQAYINPYDTMGGLTSNYLELHDLVLAIGYILVYFIFNKIKITKKSFPILAVVIFVMLLGMKRASLLGLVIAFTFNIFANRLSNSKKTKFCKIAGVLAFFICYAYIYILYDGSVFYDFLEAHGINSMGRNYYYKAVMNYASFTPEFLGIGRNVVAQLLQNELSYLRVGGVHSDIIKMYVENGFILFGFWLWYYLMKIVNIYKKKYGNDAAFLYFGLIIYTFSLYLTDNIEIYYICQIFSIMLPISYSLYGETINIKRLN